MVFRIIPIQLRAKQPLVQWREYQQRRASEREVQEWFAKWPDANIAIVTGTLSGLVVLDIDAGQGAQSLLRPERAHGPLPRTVEALSGGGGGRLERNLAGKTMRPGHPLDYWKHLARKGVPEGERNNTIASLGGHLLWHGVDAHVVLDLLLCWNAARCRPPLPE